METRAFRNMKTRFSRSISVCFMLVNAILLFGGFGLAQNAEQTDAFQRAAERIFPAAHTTGTVNKMSANSYEAAKPFLREVLPFGVPAGPSVDIGETYYVVNVEFRNRRSRKLLFTDLKKSRIKGAFVLTVFDRFADIFIEGDAQWNALAANPNIVRVEYSTRIDIPPPSLVSPSLLTSQGSQETIVRGGYRGLTGKGTIIAIPDTGVDFRHPDFISYGTDGLPTSRIAYLWDAALPYVPGRGMPAPFRFPNGTPIGTIYSRTHLTRELRSSMSSLPPLDLDGHGTTVAGIAAGNGNADNRAGGLGRKEVVGVAPEADIVAVRLGKTGLENSYLMNAACEWFESVAGKMPMVISGSFVGHGSGHDGQLIEERQMSRRYPLNRTGRAVVFAAGNDGTHPIHARISLDKTAKLVSWHALDNTMISLYFDSADSNISVSGTHATPLATGTLWEINPITKQLQGTVTVTAGSGGIWLENTAGHPTEVHLYFTNSRYGGFSPISAVSSHLVGSPGAMENAIAAGSSDWNDIFHFGGKNTTVPSSCLDSSSMPLPIGLGWLSCYSSPGPARNGVVKPDIISPGQWFTSPNAKDGSKSAGDWAKADTTGFYRQMNGTSAAAPYTAGIISLMLQDRPKLKLGEIKRLLEANLTRTHLYPFGNDLPNKYWGHGKLDEAAIDGIFAHLRKR